MSRPRSLIASAGLAGLAAALSTLLWTGADVASPGASSPAPRPPAPPAGVPQAEWDRVLADAATSGPGPDPDPFTNGDLLVLVVQVAMVAVALVGIVLWLVVVFGAARGRGWARFVALVAVAVMVGQAVLLLPLAAGGASVAYALMGAAALVTGVASAVLLWRPGSVAHTRATESPAATPVS